MVPTSGTPMPMPLGRDQQIFLGGRTIDLFVVLWSLIYIYRGVNFRVPLVLFGVEREEAGSGSIMQIKVS